MEELGFQLLDKRDMPLLLEIQCESWASVYLGGTGLLVLPAE
jgi:hypothetical protein